MPGGVPERGAATRRGRSEARCGAGVGAGWCADGRCGHQRVVVCRGGFVSGEPLLIVGHGTVDAAGVGEFTAFIDRMRTKLAPDGVDVEGGFIELSAPAVTEAWQ